MPPQVLCTKNWSSPAKHLRDLLKRARPCPCVVDPVIWSIISTNFRAWMPVRQTTDMWWQHEHGTLKNLGLDIVLATRAQQATDPRDKVFGLLGITEMGFTADYSRTSESVYSEFALKWIESGKPLEHLLIYSGCGVHASDRLKLPSWIPDYFKMLSFLVGPFLSNNILRTCGAIISTVRSMSPVMCLGEVESHHHFEFGTSYASRQTKPTYPTGIPFLQAFFRASMREQDHLQDKAALLSTSPTFVHLALRFLRSLMHTTLSAQGQDLEKTIAVCLPQLGLSPGSEFASSFSNNR